MLPAPPCEIGYEMVSLELKTYVAAKLDSPPPSTAIVLQSSLKLCPAWVNVQVQFVGACRPLIDLAEPRVGLTVHSKPVSNVIVPEALAPATEELDLHVILPLFTTVSDEPKRFSVHVVLLSLARVSVPETPLPSALVLPTKSDLGHLNLSPLLSSVQLEFVEVAVTFALTGVNVACAGPAAVASVLSIAAASSRAGLRRDFM